MSKALEFVFGDAHFLVEDYLTAFQRQHTQQVTFLPAALSAEELYHRLFGLSLFSSNQTFIWKNPDFLWGSLSDTEQDSYLNTLSQVDSTGHKLIIAIINKKIDGRKKLPAQLKKIAHAQEFAPFKDWEQDKVFNWLQRRSTAMGFKLDPEAGRLLLDTIGMDLSILAQELEKCCIYLGTDTHINTTTVKAVSSGTATTLLTFSEALQRRDKKRLIESYEVLLENGEDPVKLLGYITSQIRFYFQCCALMEAKNSVDQIAKQLGKNPFYLKRLLPAIKSGYSVEKLKHYFGLLADADLAIKSGKQNPTLAVELALSNLSA